MSPPSGGTPPPATAVVRGEVIDAWCVHDNQWLLGWAAEDLEVGGRHFARNVRWLARPLRARGYPAERLARDLELAAEVIGDTDDAHRELAEKLRQGAGLLKGH